MYFQSKLDKKNYTLFSSIQNTNLQLTKSDKTQKQLLNYAWWFTKRKNKWQANELHIDYTIHTYEA